MSVSNPPVTLVLGGARSGKSRYAESLVTAHSPPWTYLATTRPSGDGEMAARIAAHRARRGGGWRTAEVPFALAEAVSAEDRPVLVDCLTLWLTNLLLDEHPLEPAIAALEAALAARLAPTVLVSNEVGSGIVPINALARRFADEAGLLHQRIAQVAARVVFVTAGLPMVLKGERP